MEKKEIVEKLKQHNLLWIDFYKWVTNQKSESEKVLYYIHDVDQFIALKTVGLNSY